MNNSLNRMIDGMVATLRDAVIPQIGSEFARGQAFGVIYMLNSIRLRADWSPAFVDAQIDIQLVLRDALMPLVANLDAPPLPTAPLSGMNLRALEVLRDDNDARICALLDWAGNARLRDEAADRIETALRLCMDQQLKLELQTSAKPMFAEMSSGSE